MLLTADILPIDFSKNSLQVTETEGITPPGSELRASFSEILQGPVLEADIAVASVAGEDLPADGRHLPFTLENEALVETALNQPATAEAGTPGFVPPLEPVRDLAMQTQREPLLAVTNQQQQIADAKLANAIPAPLEVPAAQPTEQTGRAADALRPLGFHQQRAAVDPDMRSVTTEGQALGHAGKELQRSAEDYRGRSRADSREFVHLPAAKVHEDAAGAPSPRLAADLPSVVVAPVSPAAVLPKDNTDRLNKPNINFSGIATAGPVSELATSRQDAATESRAMPLLTTTIDVSVMDKAWGKSLQDRVMWMAGRGIHNAEIRLNPAELGPIRVQVSVDNDAAQLAFTAQNAQTREAIEMAMPRLREMLSENGLSLAGSTVSDGKQSDADKDGDSGERAVSDEQEMIPDENTEVGVSEIRQPSSSALVDTFV